jgi:hypothetical protein
MAIIAEVFARMAIDSKSELGLKLIAFLQFIKFKSNSNTLITFNLMNYSLNNRTPIHFVDHKINRKKNDKEDKEKIKTKSKSK